MPSTVKKNDIFIFLRVRQILYEFKNRQDYAVRGESFVGVNGGTLICRRS